jgi:hypothetical protein
MIAIKAAGPEIDAFILPARLFMALIIEYKRISYRKTGVYRAG